MGNLKVGTENTEAPGFYINPSPEMSDGNEERTPECHCAVKGSLALQILNLSDTDTFCGSINDLTVTNAH